MDAEEQAKALARRAAEAIEVAVQDDIEGNVAFWSDDDADLGLRKMEGMMLTEIPLAKLLAVAEAAREQEMPTMGLVVALDALDAAMARRG